MSALLLLFIRRRGVGLLLLPRSWGLAAGLLVLTALLLLLLLQFVSGWVGLVGALLAWVWVALLNHRQISKE